MWMTPEGLEKTLLLYFAPSLHQQAWSSEDEFADVLLAKELAG